MTDDPSADWEVYRLRARFYAWTGVQLAGFAVLFWGFWEMMLGAVVENYRPDLAGTVADYVPHLDPLSAIIVMGAGAMIVLLSTRTS